MGPEQTPSQVAGSSEAEQDTARGPLRFRWGALLTLLALTGFAIAQPVLSSAGEQPTLFTFADVSGGALVVVAVLVALVPPLVLWVATVGLGAVRPRLGDLALVVAGGALAGLTAIQWAKSSGLERAWALGAVGLLVAVGFGLALARVPAVGLWTRYAAPLPVLAVGLFLFASPSGELLRSPQASAAVEGAGEGLPPVVFIMLDEFALETILDADDHVDAERFPNLAALAERSTWYRNYTTTGSGTLHAVSSMLTGNYPTGSPPLWTAHPDNLFSLLVDTHHLTVSESVSQLCGYSTCRLESDASASDTEGVRSVLDQLWGLWRQRVRLGPVDDIDYGQFREEVVPLGSEDIKQVEDTADHLASFLGQGAVAPERVGDFLRAVEEGSEPHLYYLHLILPHQPWLHYPDGEENDGLITQIEALEYAAGPDRPWSMATLQQVHIWQAQYTDRLLGDILAHFEATGVLDEAVVVVTADHGVGFHGPEMRSLEGDSLGDVAFVPLFIREPGQTAGAVDESNLMAIDLLPTIAEAVGVEVDWEIDGLPAGHPALEQRGGTKVIYPHSVGFGIGLGDPVEFEADDHRPDAADRHIPPSTPGEAPIAGLMTVLEARSEIGRHLHELDPLGGAGGRIDRLEALQDPDPSLPTPGWLTGSVDDPDLGSLVLVVVNDEVVTASAVHQDGTLRTVLPPGALEPEGNELQLVQVGPGGYHLLELH